MNAQEILIEAEKFGATLVVVDGKLKATPPGLLPSDLKTAIRERASEIRAALLAVHLAADAKPANSAVGRATWPRSVVPDSRHPLIPTEARVKIEAIEVEARAKGWPAELLWNANFWDRPRGLAAVLDREDEIVEVAPDYIAILKVKRDLLRFRRTAA